MSRTVRKTKFGEVYKDGQRKKLYPYRGYSCDCYLCVGKTKEEKAKYLKDEAQKEINIGIDYIFGYAWHYENMLFSEIKGEIPRTLQEELNWEQYQDDLERQAA